MRHHWLSRNDSSRLLIFCCGWGMDHHPFLPLSCESLDVVVLFDYTTLPAEAPELPYGRYEEIVLLGWSMGVWAGRRLFGDLLLPLSCTIAINGTLQPIDDRQGIAHDIASGTMLNWAEESRLQFYQRMSGDAEIAEKFLSHQPQRSLVSQQEELAALLEQNPAGADDGFYNHVLVSERDRIMPTRNQLRFWGKKRSLMLPGGHFPFYRWAGWDELLATVRLTSGAQAPS